MSLIQDTVIASRTLAEHGVIDGYGHATVRSDIDANRYLGAGDSTGARPRTGHSRIRFRQQSTRSARSRGVPGALHSRRIYKARPEVHAIVHNHSPTVTPFACTHTAMQPIFHMTAFIGLGVPVWDIRDTQHGTDLLVRTPAWGESLAACLANHPAELMRGHASVVVGETIQRAVGRTIYLEMNARMQLQAPVLAGPDGDIVFMDDAEVAANVSWQNYDRAWHLWKTKALATLAAEGMKA